MARINFLQGELNTKLSNMSVIRCNNKGASALAANPVFHGRTKHVELAECL